MSLRPKDAPFFEAFTAHAKKTSEAAVLLHDMLSRVANGAGSERAEIEALAKKVKDAETEGDTITHDMMKRLHANWITPLDRDDIHRLISGMDDVLDEIEAVADRIVLFDIRELAPGARDLSKIIVMSCEKLSAALGLVHDMGQAKAILEHCVEVNRLENEADQLYRKALSDLFRPGNDPLMVMKVRDIFEGLEAAADRCEDVADVIEGVVLEYA